MEYSLILCLILTFCVIIDVLIKIKQLMNNPIFETNEDVFI